MNAIFIVIIAYILGSIPSGLWIGKLFYQKDIRQFGSGNLGATNSFRVLGKKPGIAVTLIDILKGTLATFLPYLFGMDAHTFHPLIAGLIAVVGHMFPLFAGFRGGKAVATSAGVILAYNPLLFVIAIVIFALVLKLSKYVSLASMIAAASAFVYSLFTKDLPLIIIIFAIAAFIVYRHRTNIIRIKNHTEPKVNW